MWDLVLQKSLILINVSDGEGMSVCVERLDFNRNSSSDLPGEITIPFQVFFMLPKTHNSVEYLVL